MEPLIELLREKRTAKQQVRLLRQRLYLWRGFRNGKMKLHQRCGGVVTKRALAKALRRRLAIMSRDESFAYYAAPQTTGYRDKEKLLRKNLSERLMIVSILNDMYALFTGPDYLGVE